MTDNTYGARLRKQRQLAGVTKEELAPILKCGPARVAQIERGEIGAFNSAWTKLVADYLGCDVRDILPEPEPPRPRFCGYCGAEFKP